MPLTNEENPKCSRWSCLDREANFNDWFCVSRKNKPDDVMKCKDFYRCNRNDRFVETGGEGRP